MIYWNNNNFCDKGFIINLKDRPERLERSLKELNKSKITGVERFDGIIIKDPNFSDFGCTESHIAIAKKQVENNWEYVLYLEDDIIFDLFYHENQRKISYDKVINQIIEDFKTFKPDVLWLGTRPETYVEKFSKVLVKPNKTLMSHAYVGSLKFAKFVVENFDYKTLNHFSYKWPIDFFISQINVKDDWQIMLKNGGEVILKNDLNVYMTLPMIFNQGEGYSDIINRHVDYSIWVRGSINEYANIKKLKMEGYYE